jgi:hypothetical protein
MPSRPGRHAKEGKMVKALGYVSLAVPACSQLQGCFPAAGAAGCAGTAAAVEEKDKSDKKPNTVIVEHPAPAQSSPAR